MKNVILASMLVMGVSAFATEHEAPAAAEQAPTTQEQQAPAPEAAKAKKAAKHGHKKADKKKAVEAHK